MMTANYSLHQTKKATIKNPAVWVVKVDGVKVGQLEKFDDISPWRAFKDFGPLTRCVGTFYNESDFINYKTLRSRKDIKVGGKDAALKAILS